MTDPRPAAPRSEAFVAAGDDDALQLPDGRDLLDSLRFVPRDGRICLGDDRMVLMHVRALGGLRRELIDALGLERARALLVRMGYASGHRDAQHARRLRQDASAYELLAAGPQLHALEGMVAVQPVEVRFDIERGSYHGEFVWRNSAEVEAHLEQFGPSAEPVCWTMLGYASGYTTVFMGRPIVYREVRCRGCGARQCRIVGRPLADWDPLPDGFAFLAARSMGQVPGDMPSAIVEPPAAPPLADGLVGASTAFRAAWSQIRRVAPATTTVLLSGETGTGKAALARALHAGSPRAGGPLVRIACADPGLDPLAELARARGGTAYLADVDQLAPAGQGRLLRALEDGGAEGARIVAGVQGELAPGTGRMRPDLYYRLAVFPVHVPPLRERRDDIPLLLRHFLERHAARQGKRVPGLTERANAALLDHDYPGNVRELENLVERAVVLVGDGAAIDVGHLFGADERPGVALGLGAGGLLQAPAGPAEAPAAAPDADLVDRLLDQKAPLELLESALIRAAVARAGGNLSAAARMLGLTRPQLAYRFRKALEE
jgi:transcriptional regulator with AAA-type ATPase domain